MKAGISLIIISILAFLIISCNTNEPVPPLEKPPGYQDDIPWPSLADSPWPMFHADAQLTGRSRFLGPTLGMIDKILPADQMQAGIAIGYDFIFYYTANGNLIASDYNGNRKWAATLAVEISSTPLIGKDSTIYFTSGSLRSVYALNKDGSVKWEYKSEYVIWNATLGIDKIGNIYFTTNHTLYALSNRGELLWKLTDSRILGTTDDAFSFSPDGNVIYLQGNTVSLIAVDINSKSVIWTFGDRMLKSGASIDDQGNLYVFPQSVQGSSDNYFYCIKPDGEIKWKFEHEEDVFDWDNVEPAIDKLGNIYFGYNKLYSIDYTGNLNWKIDLLDYKIRSSVLVDNAGNVFIGCSSTTNFNVKIASYKKSGDLNWELIFEEPRGFESSAAITNDGSLIFPTFRSETLYIIK